MEQADRHNPALIRSSQVISSAHTWPLYNITVWLSVIFIVFNSNGTGKVITVKCGESERQLQMLLRKCNKMCPPDFLPTRN